MRASINWLREHLPLELPPEELGRRLTAAGLPVEKIHDAGGGDFALEIEVTSNRPDCLGHIGVARELAALTGLTFRDTYQDPAESGPPVAELIAGVHVDAPDLCPQYVALALTGIKVGPSPLWMQRRLDAAGVRSINNVVDVTNYVMLETGQPLHAFDLDRLAGRRIVVRRARPGESITAIDGSVHVLDPAKLGVSPAALPLVIADAERPVAVAGVMGGRDSEVTPGTTRVLLESAEFERSVVRRGSRLLDLNSESARRFERGIDPAGVMRSARRAAQLLIDLAGATLAKGAHVHGSPPPAPEVTLRHARVAAVLGMPLPADEVRRTLAALGFVVLAETPESIRVRVPSSRQRDVHREIDLVEEVARVHGYDDLPEVDLPAAVAARSPRTVVLDRLADSLVAAGGCEVITKTLVKPGLVDLSDDMRPDAPAPAGTMTADPRRTAFNHVRRSVLPGLLHLRRLNQNVGVEHATLFELARGFLPGASADALPEEPARLAVTADGESEEDWRRFAGVLTAALRAAGARDVRFRAAPRAGLDPSVSLLVSAVPAGSDRAVDLGPAGRLSAEARRKTDLRRSVFVAELDIDALCAAAPATPVYHQLPRFPAVVRDLNVVLGERTLWSDIEAAVRGAGVSELESLEYRSTWTKGLPAGRKSVHFAMTFRRADETLTGEAATAAQQTILAALQRTLGAELKG